jgi:SAM-dependent methyltransferase
LKIYILNNLPFCIGAVEKPHNPGMLPNVMDFMLEYNERLCRVEQVDSAPLQKYLSEAYSYGIEMGVPSDETPLGIGYVSDFVDFIEKNIDLGCCAPDVLEIGAGTGFLAKSLKQKGWNVTAIEPGKGYSSHWEKNGVDVINDFFPSSSICKKFDVIVFYTVLEHIKNTAEFLGDVSKFLKPLGKIFLSVPDCTLELYSGDPSILLHEHYQYFTERSLANTLRDVSFSFNIEKSKYGRSLYASGTLGGVSSLMSVDITEHEILNSYGEKTTRFIEYIRCKLIEYSSVGKVGIFSPARALNYIPSNIKFCFYDDAASLHEKFYPPFDVRIHSRSDLIAHPTDFLFIASRTFGAKIRSDLHALVPNTNIVQLDQLIEGFDV